MRADLSPEAVRSYLAKFRFFGDDPFRIVRGLSGGERSRLAMAKIMLFPRNVLVLDEPTNHLDIPARETLEDALGAYEGTLIIVSHDRYFLDRICTRLLVIDGTHVEAHTRQLQRLARARARKRPPRSCAPCPRPETGAQARLRVATAAQGRWQARSGNASSAASARRVETLEADVGKLEAELARRARRACRGSRRRLAEAAHAGRARTRARRLARPPDGGVGGRQHRALNPDPTSSD